MYDIFLHIIMLCFDFLVFNFLQLVFSVKQEAQNIPYVCAYISVHGISRII